MGNILFIACAFSRPERTYDRMASAIEALGPASVEIQFGLWHIDSGQTADQVRDRLKPALDVNDQLVVIDASNCRTAWIHLGKEASESLRALDK
jgi:hypothetical protein